MSEDRKKFGFGALYFSPFAWPIMIPEAIENFLAEVGVLKVDEPDASRQVETVGDDSSVTDLESLSGRELNIKTEKKGRSR